MATTAVSSSPHPPRSPIALAVASIKWTRIHRQTTRCGVASLAASALRQEPHFRTSSSALLLDSSPPPRPEMVVGWYHSHPGFGCWLSGVDINTEQNFEALNHQRAIAESSTILIQVL
ncbi:hypothetical protein QQ045_011877 [Rhodiola kirilowii]